MTHASITPSRIVAVDHLILHCGSVRPDESVLVLCNTQTRDLAELFVERARRHARAATLAELPFTNNHGQEPPPEVADAMGECALTVALCVYSLAHSAARKRAAAKGGRFLSMPMYTWALLDDPAVLVDYRGRRAIVERVAAKLTAGATARVTSPAGTDLRLDLRGREGHRAPGYVEHPGDLGSPPDIESNIAPVETASVGVIVVDGSVATPEIGLVTRPLRLEVEGGKVCAVSGEDAAAVAHLESMLGERGSPRRVVAELGIGLNPLAKLTGLMLTDEGTLGVHIGLGSNSTIGGANYAGFHLDVITRSAHLEIDGETILADGEIRC